MKRTERTVRPPAVAGMFYPSNPAVLRGHLDTLLAEARREPLEPKALVVPHAGYRYSGAIAASAYVLLEESARKPGRVVLLGPAHTVDLEGLALPGCDAMATPLGEVPVDRDAVDELRELPQVVVSEAAHAREHSLEVQLPFLQRVLGAFRLVPLVVGRASPGEVEAVLERLWGGEETLVVVSSDLSHYLPYDVCRELDAETASRIVAFDAAHLDGERACGAQPLRGFLRSAKRHGLEGRLLDLRNSGDTAGDRSRVVGYGAFSFVTPRSERGAGHQPLEETQTAPPTGGRGERLLALVRRTLESSLRGEGVGDQGEGLPEEPKAVFVTLTKDGRLRGCVGQPYARYPLAQAVVEAARGAAFGDPRFDPLEEHELDEVRIEVSVLSPRERLEVASEAEALAMLRPGVDGVVLSCGHRSGLFLPEMWKVLPDREEFLFHLKRKAGLPVDRWLPGTQVDRFTADVYAEPGAGLTKD